MATETYLLSIQGTLSTEYRENIMAFQSAGLSSADTLDAGVNLINAWNAGMSTLWMACMPGSYFLNRLLARRAFPKPSAEAHSQAPPLTIAGTRGPNATSQNLCPTVFLVPPMGTKSGGRVFMPAVAKGDIVNNQPIAGYQAALTAYFNAAIAGFAGTGTTWKLAVFSRRLVSASLVNSFSISPRLGYQSRRRDPVGG